MLLRSLHTLDFRNLRDVEYRPHPRFNVIFGDNGGGKTNLLEAIFLVATQRAFRSSKLDEICRFGTGKAEVIAAVSLTPTSSGDWRFSCLPNPAEKSLLSTESPRVRDYFTGVHVVLFAPEDLLLPKGPPEDRRRFLDRAIWNTCPNYLDEVRVYEQVLKSRNAVLRSMLLQTGRPQRSDSFGDAGMQISSGGDSDAMLAVYTEQLAQAGARIIERRRHYVRTIAPQVEATFERISRSGLAANVSYRPKLSAHLQDRAVDSAETPELCEILHEQFERDTRRDRLRGFTHSGPHGDDMLVSLDGREAALHASQGQVRALVLALKITEIQHLFFCTATRRSLLLDDVSSELDAQRNGYLFDFCARCRAKSSSPRRVRNT